jgi:hypothetical protein
VQLMVRCLLEIEIFSLRMFVTGNYTIGVSASPVLFDIIVEASKMVRRILVESTFL